MPDNGNVRAEELANENFVEEAHRVQLTHFVEADPRCRGMQLPDGVLLRYNFAHSLYFYLRTGIKDGKINTRLFASDSPYDRQKAAIGEVATPMFEGQAELVHLRKIEKTRRGWVEFVGEAGESLAEFKSFSLSESRDGDS
jgi:hypothetical protein